VDCTPFAPSPDRQAAELFTAYFDCVTAAAILSRNSSATRKARAFDVTLREEAATDKKLMKLARSVINLRTKKALKKPNYEKSGMLRAVTGLIKKVTR
jgi:hypothetical protein